jgi:CheY-specific phosphatase CheX
MTLDLQTAKSLPTQLALDESLAKEIASAVCCAMRETFSAEVSAAPYEIGEGMVSLVGDVSGVIGMVQSQLEGTLILCLPFEALHDLLPQVLGKDFNITHEMALDAVGEITNMIFGQVKRDLNARGFQIKLGIPCVVTGKAHFVSQFHRGKYLIVPFQLDGHLFQVYVALHPSRLSAD